jgi:hypothetical protein
LKRISVVPPWNKVVNKLIKSVVEMMTSESSGLMSSCVVCRAKVKDSAPRRPAYITASYRKTTEKRMTEKTKLRKKTKRQRLFVARRFSAADSSWREELRQEPYQHDWPEKRQQQKKK